MVATKSSTDVARFRIAESQLTRTVEDKPSGLGNLFDSAPRETFTVRVAAHLEVRRSDGSLVQAVTGKAWGEESFATDLELPARRIGVNELVKRVMGEFDHELAAAIRANMANLVA